MDIVAASAGIHHLQVEAWYCSPINVGSGTVVCACWHLPVPAPATADLLRGMPTFSAHVQMELVTPTGAALPPRPQPHLLPAFRDARREHWLRRAARATWARAVPTCERLSIGESSDANTQHDPDTEVVTVLETALDDISPQLLAHVAEAALAGGALDVMLTPVIMKKGRPGTLLTCPLQSLPTALP